MTARQLIIHCLSTPVEECGKCPYYDQGSICDVFSRKYGDLPCRVDLHKIDWDELDKGVER